MDVIGVGVVVWILIKDEVAGNDPMAVSVAALDDTRSGVFVFNFVRDPVSCIAIRCVRMKMRHDSKYDEYFLAILQCDDICITFPHPARYWPFPNDPSSQKPSAKKYIVCW